MTRPAPLRPSHALAISLLSISAIGPVGAQLPMLTAPSGTLRIELRGDFAPVSSVWIDGAKHPLGALVSRTAALDGTTPLVAEVNQRVSTILGSPANAGTLGRVESVAEWQRGVGTIGLAYGVTKRITIFANLPIVSVRTQVELVFDPEGATLGLNPADAILGSSAGFDQNTAFFGQFDAALTELATRISRGDYASNPQLQALAQQTLDASPSLRAGLFELLADPLLSSPVLPTAGSAAGTALTGRITSLQNTFSDDLGIAFDAAPALPTAAITADGFQALLDASTAFGFSPRNLAPRVSLGDAEVGVVVQAFERRSGTSSLSAWGRGALRLPTGEAAAAADLLGQGSGDRQLDIELGGVVEVSRGRIGLRAEGSYIRQLAGDVEARLGNRRSALIPARFLAAVRRDPGDIVAVTAQPYFRLAPHLAIAGLVQHTRRGDDAVALIEGQPPISGASVGDLAQGTGMDATTVGLGLSYSHDGLGREGILRMPVEAQLSVERTVASGSGVVPAAMTSRVMFRVYKKVR